MREGKRVDLCYEGLDTRDGRRIEPGALDFWHEYVPVTANDGKGMNEVIGRASKFERREVEEGRNVISAVIELTDSALFDVEKTNRHIDITAVKTRQDGDVMVITGGTLRAVFLSRGPGGWPVLDVVAEADGPRSLIPDGGPTLEWAVDYAKRYWTFGDSAETQAALHVLARHATADVGEAVVEHMEHPVLLDLDDEALEWLTGAAADFSEDVRAMMQAALDARRAGG